MAKTKSYLLALCLVVILFAGSLICFGVTENVNAYVGTVDSTSIKSVYSFGENIEIEQVDIKYESNGYKSDGSYVILPDGKSVDSTSLRLTQVGEYEIVYFTNQNGRKIYAYKTFEVTSNVYDVTSEKSSAEYKKPDAYETAGIVVKLVEGDEFKFNRVLNVSDYVKGDSILGFYAIPETFGVADCKDVVLKLTDAYDSTNFVEVKISNVSYMGSWADVATYVKGSSYGQTFVGICSNTLGESWTRNDWGGLQSDFTLTGKLAHTVHTGLDGNIFNFYLDYNERQIWTDSGIYHDGRVINLDDKNSFPKIWDGFTTGECFLSIRGENYQSSSLNLVITNVDGNDLTEEVLLIDNNIIIDVDMQGYAEVPFAKINKKYNLFDTTAKSRYQNELVVEKAVYYNYGSANQLNVSIENNGFVPKRAGVYTIVYSVKDNYGNLEKKAVDVLAKDVGNLELVCSQTTDKCDIGTEYSSIAVTDVKNASGNFVISGEVYKDGVKYCDLSENLSFVPEHEGSYSIKIKCSDLIETVEENYSLTVEKKDISKIIGESLLPKYFIKNAKYALDVLTTKNYQTGKPTEDVAEIYIKEDDKAQEKLSSFEYVVNANNVVEVEYKTKDGADKKTYSIPVVDVGYGGNIDLRKYFAKSDDSVSLVYEGGYLAMETDSDGYVEFINKVMVSDFSAVLKTNKQTCNYDRINLYLEDCLTAKKVKFSFVSESGTVALVINDGDDMRTVSGSFTASGGFEVGFRYNAIENSATIDGENFVPVRRYSDGTAFKGFTANRAFLIIEAEDVASRSTVSIKKINNQSFTDDITTDSTKPQYYVKTITGDRIVGEEFLINGSDFCDVLDPYTYSTMKISSMDENFIENVYVNKDGVVFNGKQDFTKDYRISFEALGDYSILYSAKDGSGNTTRYSYVISVIDNTPPTVTLDNVVSKAKVNDDYKIAKYVLADDVSKAEDIKIIIYLLSPDNIFTEIKGDSVRFTTEGKHKIVYLAFDEEGNQTIVKYTVEVGR